MGAASVVDMFELNPNGDEGAAEATACGDMKGARGTCGMLELNPNGDEGAAEATACGDMKGARGTCGDEKRLE